MGPRHHLSFCACTTAGLTSELLVSMGPSPLQWFLHAKSVVSIRITSLYGSQPSCLVLDAKQRLFYRNNKSLWVPAITCGFMHAKQRDYHLNYRCLWVSALVCVFCMPNSTFGPELQVSMGPRPHLSFCACKTAWFAPKWQVHMGFSPHLWFCVFKTATLRLELQVSAGEETPPVVSACKTVTSGPE